MQISKYRYADSRTLMYRHGDSHIQILQIHKHRYMQMHGFADTDTQICRIQMRRYRDSQIQILRIQTYRHCKSADTNVPIFRIRPERQQTAFLPGSVSGLYVSPFKDALMKPCVETCAQKTFPNKIQIPSVKGISAEIVRTPT